MHEGRVVFLRTLENIHMNYDPSGATEADKIKTVAGGIINDHPERYKAALFSLICNMAFLYVRCVCLRRCRINHPCEHC